jgi:hypothetical protein
MDDIVSLETTPKYAKGYFSHLCGVMGLKDGVLYSNTHCFLKSDLLELTPSDICCYFNTKAFGTTNPGDDYVPEFGLSLSLMYYKNSISFFMSNKLNPWNIGSASGNPTKGIEVNEIVKRVQKM